MSDRDKNEEVPTNLTTSNSKRRKRSSSTSSSSDSSSSSSTSSSSSGRPRNRNKRVHTKKRAQRSKKPKSAKQNRHEDLLEKLLREVSDLRNHVYNTEHREPNIDLDISRELYSDDCNCENSETSNNVVLPDHPQNDFIMQFNTSLKTPTVPKTPGKLLEKLKDLQRFNSADWCDVRFSEVQKNYLSSPGYVELETNDEIRSYDKTPNLAYAEKSYAALTAALLKQQSAFQEGIRGFLSWVRNPENLSVEKIEEKIDTTFSKGDYQKVSNDLIQMVCGHRADVVEQRRESILASVKDPLIKSSLRKIAPSCKDLFDSDPFTAALEKVGGVRKAFWSKTHKPAAQAKPESNRFPAQGQSTSQSGSYYPHNKSKGSQPNFSRNRQSTYRSQYQSSAQEQGTHSSSSKPTNHYARQYNNQSRDGKKNFNPNSKQGARKRQASPSFPERKGKQQRY
ncbi:hypothetical protein ABMA28_015206 [Loxostege sticticalis]|uniref:Uncharacterized protein n=1 Tax=Loxostege sticticalis TaxID=481309 RepID=A0ABD0TEN5_LOXSC